MIFNFVEKHKKYLYKIMWEYKIYTDHDDILHEYYVSTNFKKLNEHIDDSCNNNFKLPFLINSFRWFLITYLRKENRIKHKMLLYYENKRYNINNLENLINNSIVNNYIESAEYSSVFKAFIDAKLSGCFFYSKVKENKILNKINKNTLSIRIMREKEKHLKIINSMLY